MEFKEYLEKTYASWLGKTIGVRTFSPLFALSRLTQHLAWRTAPYDQFEIVVE